MRRYEAGVVAPVDDLTGLTDGVRRLLDDADELARARAGALRARTELTWDAAAMRFEAAYRSVVRDA